MTKTPKSMRLHIGLFGRRNVGKSSILNALVKQQVAIVSAQAGTTTDPVEKVMELKPIGPVVFIDTAGIDDEGALGKARMDQTSKVLNRTELAILVSDEWTNYENQLIELFRQKNIPFVLAANKADLRNDRNLERTARDIGVKLITTTNAPAGTGIDNLRQAVIEAAPEEFITGRPFITDLIKPGELVMLVTPIDIEAPKGRLKMLQVHCMREILDTNSFVMAVKETELPAALGRLNKPPSLIVTDSQVFNKCLSISPPQVRMTTFSILMARLKGDFDELAEGTQAIGSLRPGDKVLIAEACSHHPIGEDIGREQIPRLLTEYVGGPLEIDVTTGRDFPDDLSDYKLIIHCGACVFNRKEMLWRIEHAVTANIPITNYGMVITYLQGDFPRAMEPLLARRKTSSEKVSTMT
ncbi:MAG: [FeFe] hydrogenase H-cluster maturation GTPase HydF [Sedimentisphaerales bacterium]|nr:[FeFe] hydrogenase H-cluster maturation GTPase HydF [Sedimentisphaerales bacterium]